MPTRRTLMLAALAFPIALSIAAVSAPAGAAEVASADKPITLVVPFAEGGPTDAMARLLAEALQQPLGQAVRVENRAGAGGNLGAERVAQAPADGRTVLFGTSGPLAINGSLYRKQGYDPLKSFAPVIKIGHLPNVLIVNPALPVTNVQELIAYSKAHPGQLSYASSGNGASSHLAGAWFNQLAGSDFFHIPYKGTGPALDDLLAGRVSMAFTDVMTALPHLQSGRLRALGVTTLTRSPILAELPTVAEQGVAGFDVSVFFGVVVPAGTPKARIERLNKAFVAVLAQTALRQTLQSQGLEFASDSRPEALGRFMRGEATKWRAIVQRSGAVSDER